MSTLVLAMYRNTLYFLRYNYLLWRHRYNLNVKYRILQVLFTTFMYDRSVACITLIILVLVSLFFLQRFNLLYIFSKPNDRFTLHNSHSWEARIFCKLMQIFFCKEPHKIITLCHTNYFFYKFVNVSDRIVH